MIHEHWELSDEAKESVQPYIDYLTEKCPEMLTLQTRRLIALARVNLPAMTTKEAALLVKCLCGFSIPDADSVPTDEIAKMIADEIRETFVVEFGAEHLAEEKKQFGHDPEWQAHFRQMPENLFADRLEATLDPLQAYLLIVMVECYWEREHSTQNPKLSDFFNIED
jgi:hypothetical protein